MKNLKETILNNLKARPGEYIPGNELAGNLTPTRAAIWKQVQRLRREGYRISARPRLGYRLDGLPDRLDLLLPSKDRLWCLSTVDSTNAAARRLAEEGAPGGTVVIAEEQTRGRGRRNRSWSSDPGKGIWFSLLLRPENICPSLCAPLALVAAVSLARTLRVETGLPVKVKWPNDLLLKEKKVCGILTELKGEPDRVDYLILGAGLNVNHQVKDFPPSLREKAGSLYLAGGRFIARAELFLSLQRKLLEDCHTFFEQGFALFLPLWREYSSSLGHEVTVIRSNKIVEGKALDLDRSGALLLKDKEGKIHRMSYGEII